MGLFKFKNKYGNELKSTNIYSKYDYFIYFYVHTFGTKWVLFFTWELTHFSRETPKTVIGKQLRTWSDAIECGIWSGSTLFALTTGISIMHSNHKK